MSSSAWVLFVCCALFLLLDSVQAFIKPQYVDQIPKAVDGQVEEILIKRDDTGTRESFCEQLGMFCKMLISHNNYVFSFRNRLSVAYRYTGCMHSLEFRLAVSSGMGSAIPTSDCL